MSESNYGVKMLTAERARELFEYDPEIGTLTRKIGPMRGNIIKARTRSGHVLGYADGKLYYVHRLAWLIVTGKWPIHTIDHIDCDPSNNIFSNLRQATQSQNNANTKAYRTRGRKTDLKGAYLDPDGTWFSHIVKNGVKKYLGRFNTPEEAHKAYCNAAHQVHGQFARTK